MKSEIKELYKKDKTLAIQVADALGFKIKAFNRMSDSLKKALDALSKSMSTLFEDMDDIDDAFGGKAPKEIDEEASKILKSLSRYRKLIRKS